MVTFQTKIAKFQFKKRQIQDKKRANFKQKKKRQTSCQNRKHEGAIFEKIHCEANLLVFYTTYLTSDLALRQSSEISVRPLWSSPRIFSFEIAGEVHRIQLVVHKLSYIPWKIIVPEIGSKAAAQNTIYVFKCIQRRARTGLCFNTTTDCWLYC